MSGSAGRAPGPALRRVVAKILSSRKYRNVAPEVVRRVAAEALRVVPTEREATKRARRKLHQVHGAFGGYVDYERIEALVRLIEACPREPQEQRIETIRSASREALTLHASTAERLGFMEGLYAGIFGGMDMASGRPRILDLGCGLDPFAIPWMGLPAGAAYHVVDLDTRLALLIDRYLAAIGRAGGAMAEDILTGELPPGPWDTVMALKLVPTLERQERGGAARILRSLETRRAVLSFPRASLGGRRKGMDEQYERLVSTLSADAGMRFRRLAFPAEVLYICERATSAPGPDA